MYDVRMYVCVYLSTAVEYTSKIRDSRAIHSHTHTRAYIHLRYGLHVYARRGSGVDYSSAPGGWLAHTHAQRVRAPSVGLIVEQVPPSRQPKLGPPELITFFPKCG
jgi:hypothetical protein